MLVVWSWVNCWAAAVPVVWFMNSQPNLGQKTNEQKVN